MSDPTAPDNASDETPDVSAPPAGVEAASPPPAQLPHPAPAQPPSDAGQPPSGTPAQPPFVAPGQNPYTAGGQPPYGTPAPQPLGGAAPQPYGGAAHPPYGPPGQAQYGAPQPPYPAAGQPYPASGQPYPGSSQPNLPSGQPPYGTSVPPYGAPASAYAGASAGPDTRPKTLAIVALALAVVGLIMAFIPIVTWFSGIFLLAGFVIGLIALISRKQGGTPFSIAALAVSVVGWIVSLIVTIASFAALGQATSDAISDGLDSTTQSPAPEESASEEPDAAAAQPITVVETAFGQSTFDPSIWWYVVVLDNPNADFVYDFASIDVEAIDDAGTILDTASEFPTVLSGRSAITGSFVAVGDGVITSLDVRLPAASEAVRSPADETGTITVEDLTAIADEFSTTVSGTVSGSFDEDQQTVAVVVVARAADGSIVGGEWTYVERLPADGTRVQFEATFFDPLPADTTFEAYPSL